MVQEPDQKHNTCSSHFTWIDSTRHTHKVNGCYYIIPTNWIVRESISYDFIPSKGIVATIYSHNSTGSGIQLLHYSHKVNSCYYIIYTNWMLHRSSFSGCKLSPPKNEEVIQALHLHRSWDLPYCYLTAESFTFLHPLDESTCAAAAVVSWDCSVSAQALDPS